MEQEAQLSAAKVEEIVKSFFWMLPNFAMAVAVAVAFIIAGAILRRIVRRVFTRRGRENLGELLGAFVRWGVIGLGFLVVAAIIFPSIKPADLLSTLGVGSIAIGFAFKDILQNWMAGLLILWRQPFRRGDQIVVGKFEGNVEHVEARATLIKTYDGRRVVIPNSDVYGTAVIVNTAYPERRSQLDIGVGFAEDVPRVRTLVLELLGDMEGVAEKPAPEVLAWDIGESTLVLRVRWWTRSQQSEVVHIKARLVEKLSQALDTAKIDLPYPTRTIKIDRDVAAGADP